MEEIGVLCVEVYGEAVMHFPHGVQSGMLDFGSKAIARHQLVIVVVQ